MTFDELCVRMNKIMRLRAIQPSSHLQLLHAYTLWADDKMEELHAFLNRLENGDD